MYPPSIADQLRIAGHDAESVVMMPELRSLADPDLFAVAQSQNQTLVTENVADFSRIADDFDSRGVAHFGLILVVASKYPRAQGRTVGRMVTALDDLLCHHDEPGPMSARHWL